MNTLKEIRERSLMPNRRHITNIETNHCFVCLPQQLHKPESGAGASELCLSRVKGMGQLQSTPEKNEQSLKTFTTAFTPVARRTAFSNIHLAVKQDCCCIALPPPKAIHSRRSRYHGNQLGNHSNQLLDHTSSWLAVAGVF